MSITSDNTSNEWACPNGWSTENRNRWLRRGRNHGVNKYVTRLILGYNDKLGLVEKDLTDNQVVYFGNVLEDVVAQEYSRRIWRKGAPEEIRYSDTNSTPWMIAKHRPGYCRKKKLLECKTTSAHINSEWIGAGRYLIRCRFITLPSFPTRMARDGLWRGGFSCFDWREPVPNLQHQAGCHFGANAHRERKGVWENHVLTQIPPELVSLSDIQAFYAKDDGSSISANVEIMTQVAELEFGHEELKDCQTTNSALRQALVWRESTLFWSV